MKRIIFRTAALSLGLLVWAITAPAFALTGAESAAVEKAENYLNAIKTMQARFLQVNPDGSTLEGDLYIARPGKMRLVYDPPTPMLMVADGAFLIYVDTEMNDASHINLSDTPAGLLLKDNLSFSDSDVRLGGVKLGAGMVEITTSMANDTAAGTLTLVFSDAPFELRQWRVVDAQNKEVAVTIFEARRGVKLDSALFRYDARRSGERD
tara:strand:+ start:1966 stop:2592 length:627 start_codon:yes stop_codon:yes gene_type:complete